MRKIGLVLVSICTLGMVGVANAQTDTSYNTNKSSEGYYFESPDNTDMEENELKTHDTSGTFQHQTQSNRKDELDIESTNQNYKEYEFDSDEPRSNQDLKTESDHGGYQNDKQERHETKKSDKNKKEYNDDNEEDMKAY